MVTEKEGIPGDNSRLICNGLAALARANRV